MLDNIYPESAEESGRYLRMALQAIARYKLPYNPITYAVWYEYAQGRNQDLISALEKLNKAAVPLDQKTMLKVFRKFIASNQTLQTEKKALEFQAIMTGMMKHLGESGVEMDKQGDAIAAYAKHLSESDSIGTITEIARNIASEATAMVSSGKTLKTRMDGTATEINALRKELEGIKKAARTDMLTGLYNRRGFDRAVAQVMETFGPADTLGLVMMDIDHFKKVNDTHGHLIGDNVLKLLARLIKDHIKGRDTAARFGGEEFILLLPGTPAEGAFSLAEQIRKSLKQMKWITKDTGVSIGTITISAGVAQYRPGEDISELIERADKALYQAKNTGRDRTVLESNLLHTS